MEKRIHLSFVLCMAAMALFLGLAPVIWRLPIRYGLPVWLSALLSTILPQLAYAAAAIIPCRRCEKQEPWHRLLDLKPAAGRYWYFATAGTFLLYFLLALLTGLWTTILKQFGVDIPEQLVIRLLKNGSPNLFAVLAFCSVFCAPVGEEFCFRYVIFHKLKIHSGLRTAIWAGSIFFAAIHMNLQSFPALLLLALWLTWLYLRSGSLLPSMTAHTIFNAMTILAVWMIRAQVLHP